MLYTATTFVCALIVVAMQMPAKQIVNAGPAPVGPYSPAVKAGSLIYLSGTLAQDAAGAIVGKGDIAAQTRRVIERMHEILTLSGSSLEQVVAVTVYLRNAGDFAAMNDAYKAHWPLNPPTRTTVIANLVLPDALVEMSMIAVPLGAERTVIHPAGWMRSPNPYSYAIRSGETLFLSGLVSRNGRDNSVVTGDITQIDLAGGIRSGLKVVRTILEGIDDVEFTQLTSRDVVRHRLVSDIVDAYSRYDNDEAVDSRPQRGPR